ncbi:MAG: phosphoribosyltransferase [Candidatus Marsarchaeota archaeon]
MNQFGIERYVKPSYDEIRELAFTLYEKIRQSGWIEDVDVALGRGGLFALRSLQDYYVAAGIKIPYTVISVERYTGIGSGAGGAVKMKGLSPSAIKGKKVLLVDDVSDTGATLAAVKEACAKKGAAEVRSATIHFKPWSRLKPDYYAQRVDAWIIYPWNLYETLRELVTSMRGAGLGGKEIAQELSRANVLPSEVARLKDLVGRQGEGLGDLLEMVLKEMG